MSDYTDEDKFHCAMREWKMRLRVYPRWVERGSMLQEEADREIAIMAAIVEDYRPKRLL